MQSGRIIAQGSHAHIVLCVERNPPTVIKLVRAREDGYDPARIPHNIVLEREILGSCQHEHIIELLSSAYVDGEHRLELPYLLLSLRDVMQRHLYPFESEILVRGVASAVTSALEYLHGRNIAHRDICPSNIMVDRNGKIKLIDFGTAFAPELGVGVETQGSMVCQVGTGTYRAPELLFGSLEYDARKIDMWSLGVVLANILRLVQPHNPPGVVGNPLDMDEISTGSLRTLFDDSFGEIGLAASIFRIRGSPSSSTWPEFAELPDADKVNFDHFEGVPLTEILRSSKHIDGREDLLDLLENLLALSPARRPSAAQAQAHSYFHGKVPDTRALSDLVRTMRDAK